ncbi:hypothetical protein NBRC116494_12700 [Aurantivibrio plasticivorans]
MKFAVTMLLAVSLFGCASAKMEAVLRTDVIEPGKALVNFIRPSVFIGDGVTFEMWDGDIFVGLLKPGTMIQHQVKPGKHTFMVDLKNQPWSHVKANLQAGESYITLRRI